MGGQVDSGGRVEALRGLMERLCAPNLTLGEARDLRARLSDLLGRPERHDAPDWPPAPTLDALNVNELTAAG